MSVDIHWEERVPLAVPLAAVALGAVLMVEAARLRAQDVTAGAAAIVEAERPALRAEVPTTASVQPPASNAPSCAAPSMPSASPETMQAPASASARANWRAWSAPWAVGLRLPTMASRSGWRSAAGSPSRCSSSGGSSICSSSAG